MVRIASIAEADEYSHDGVWRLDYESEIDGYKDWALALPSASSDIWVVLIHGHGSTADQLLTREDIRRLWLSRFVEQGLNVLSPNVRGNSWMGASAASDLHDLLGDIRSRYGASKFVFVSGSMGGTSNLIYAVVHPEDVAGVVALGAATDLASYHSWCRASGTNLLNEIADAIECSYGAPDANPETYNQHSALLNAASIVAPTAIVHGGADEIIPVSQTRALAAAMGNSADFAYLEVPDGDHDSSNNAHKCAGLGVIKN